MDCSEPIFFINDTDTIATIRVDDHSSTAYVFVICYVSRFNSEDSGILKIYFRVCIRVSYRGMGACYFRHSDFIPFSSGRESLSLCIGYKAYGLLRSYMPTLHLYGVTLSISSVLAVLFFRDENIEECYTFNLHKTLANLDNEITNLGYALSILLTQNNNTLGLPTLCSTTTPLSNIIL